MSESYGNYLKVNDTSINIIGQKIFNTNCSGCHNFKQDGIGPQLSGVATYASEEWIVQFIKNSKQLINSNDERAVKVFNKYKKAEMPAFEAFNNDELHTLYIYIKSQKKTETAKGNNNEKGLSNPIKDSIAVSNLLINLEPFIQIPPSANKPPLARITKLSFQPISGNLFINDLQGKLYKIKNGKPFIYLDLQKLKNKFSNNPGLGSGLGSFAFHPSFQSNGLFYTAHSELTGSGIADFSFADSISVDLQWVVTEWKTNKINEDIFSGTNRELLRINFIKVNHGIQEITFNPLSKIGSKDYGIPSVKSAWWAQVKGAGSVSRSIFWPAPNVDSKLVSFTRRATPGDEAMRKKVFTIIDAAFAQRRKMLRSALSSLYGSSALAEEILTQAGIDPTLRGEALEISGFCAIALASPDNKSTK
jgi:cytochrome c2